MSVKFKCNVSGNVIEMFYDVDIVTTRENPAYTEVKEEVKQEEKEEKPVAKKTTKKHSSEE